MVITIVYFWDHCSSGVNAEYSAVFNFSEIFSTSK